jgi:hypothetical protein
MSSLCLRHHALALYCIGRTVCSRVLNRARAQSKLHTITSHQVYPLHAISIAAHLAFLKLLCKPGLVASLRGIRSQTSPPYDMCSTSVKNTSTWNVCICLSTLHAWMFLQCMSGLMLPQLLAGYVIKRSSLLYSRSFALPSMTAMCCCKRARRPEKPRRLSPCYIWISLGFATGHGLSKFASFPRGL